MATKSKKYKNPTPVRIICLVLSVVFATGSAFFTVVSAAQVFFTGRYDVLTNPVDDYFETGYFGERLERAVINAENICSDLDSDIYCAEMLEEKGGTVERCVEAYLENQSNIIRSELQYAVNHYSDDDYSETDYAEETTGINLTSAPEESTTAKPEEKTTAKAESTKAEDVSSNTEKKAAPEEKTTAPDPFIVDKNSDIPQAIQEAKYALENAKGNEILQYKHLVRSFAFEESWDINVTLPSGRQIYIHADNSGWSKEDALKNIAQRYDEECEALRSSCAEDLIYSLERLKGVEEIKYYISSSDGKSVYTNEEDGEEFINGIKTNGAGLWLDSASNGIWVKAENGKVSVTCPVDFTGGEYFYNLADRLENHEISNNNYYIYVPAGYEPANNVSAFMEQTDYGRNLTACIITAAVLLVLCIINVIALAAVTGHERNSDETALRRIDRLYTDVHFVISFFMIAAFFGLALAAAGVFCIESNGGEFTAMPLALAGVCLSIAITMLFIDEWVTSTARLVKADEKLFGRTLVAVVLKYIARKIKSIVRLMKYKPGNFGKNVIITSFLLAGANILLAVIAGSRSLRAVAIIAILVLDGVAGYFAAKYFRKLDAIIQSAKEGRDVKESTEGYPPSLRTLSESISVTNERLSRAVETAVKDERMKAELITNVSHDLKTPLTSIINYVDLLSKCEIRDETANEYIGILSERSLRLKSLVEDLVEASKASSGAIQINKIRFDLCELVSQITGEMNERFDSAQLSVKIQQPQEGVSVFADGQKTCRIIENLLGNACKYSAPCSRVYIDVTEANGRAVLTVRNISRDELNVSPDELMERFVRGDSSRADGGNGLGLSIAKNLALLQNGDLAISIDGDLFKAELTLPQN